MKLTYGHAMNEYCFFRWHTKEFIYRRYHKFQTVQRLGVITAMHNAINCVSEHSATAAFYHDASEKKDQKVINTKINSMLEEDEKQKRRILEAIDVKSKENKDKEDE